MKKSLLYLLALIFSGISLSGCLKKGADDPFLSLRTRKARVAGEWMVSSGSGSSVYTSNTTTTSTTWTYSNPNMNVTSGSGKPAASNITFNYTFKKDGTYTLATTTTNTVVAGSVTESESGSWNFTDGMGNVKKRSQIVLTVLSKTTVTVVGGKSTSTSETYTGMDNSTIYDIQELKNKEMVIKKEGTSKNSSTPPVVGSDSETWTLTQ